MIVTPSKNETRILIENDINIIEQVLFLHLQIIVFGTHCLTCACTICIYRLER